MVLPETKRLVRVGLKDGPRATLSEIPAPSEHPNMDTMKTPKTRARKKIFPAAFIILRLRLLSIHRNFSRGTSYIIAQS